MKLAFTSDDRLLPHRPRSRGRGLLTAASFGLVLPLTLVAAGLACWYIATGETPAELFERLRRGPFISMAMPEPPVMSACDDAASPMACKCASVTASTMA